MRARHLLIGCFVSAFPFVVAATTARAQAPQAVPAPDPAFDTAKSAFEALPEGQRRAIQDALIWTGDYKGVVDGGFGRGTFAAMSAYAKRAGLPAGGFFDGKASAALLAAANAAKTTAGFALARDGRSGVALSLPLKLLTKRVDAKTGSLWSAADGAVTVETSATRESDGDLASQFDKLKDSKGPRHVTYKIARPDFLVVSGVNGTSAFYTRVARGQVGGDALLRGFSMSWPSGNKAMENMAVAVANSFDPFPGAPAAAAKPIATAPTAPGQAPAAVAVAPPAARRLVLAATAINLGGDKAVAAAAGACEGAQIGGHAAKALKNDPKTGLSLFDVPGLGGQGLAGPAGSTQAGEDALALFRAATTATASQTVLASGQVVGEGAAARVLAPIDETGAGGPVFARSGAFLGLVGPRAAPTRVAGVVPQATWPLIPASFVAEFSAITPPAGAAAPAAPAVADIAAMAKNAVLPMSCLR